MSIETETETDTAPALTTAIAEYDPVAAGARGLVPPGALAVARDRRTGRGGGMSAAAFATGDRVIYVPMHAHGDRTHADCEHGKVSSVSPYEIVFVRFDAAVARLGWDGATSQACYPDSLVHENLPPADVEAQEAAR